MELTKEERELLITLLERIDKSFIKFDGVEVRENYFNFNMDREDYKIFRDIRRKL